MSIEFRLLCDDAAEVSLEHREFGTLHEAFTVLERRSGVRIDPYGKTRVSPEQCQTLLSAMTQAQLAVPRIAELHRLLTTAAKLSRWVQVEGD